MCLRMPSFSSEIEAASGVTPKNTILSTYRLGSHSRRPKLQEIVALPQPTNIGCIFSPCRSISTPNQRISIILALHTLKILLSNVENQNHTPNIPNYRIYVVQSSPTNANHFSKCRRLHCYHHVTVCCMSCCYLPPRAFCAICDLDEVDSIRNCCVLLPQYYCIGFPKQEQHNLFPNNATPSFL